MFIGIHDDDNENDDAFSFIIVIIKKLKMSIKKDAQTGEIHHHCHCCIQQHKNNGQMKTRNTFS